LNSAVNVFTHTQVSHEDVARDSSELLPPPTPTLGQITAYAIELGRERLNPSLCNSDYLVLKERRKKFTEWLQRVPGENLHVLDVGGRIQPFRPLLEGRMATYVAVDPRPTGLVDAVAVGEHLPFGDATFDLVICTQVLCYATDPQQFIGEIYRVLRPRGTLLLSTPSYFPHHAGGDFWRFLPHHLDSLLSGFSHVEISPEGYSVAGICRALAVFLDFSFENRRGRRLVNSILIPLANLIGERLDCWSKGDTRFTNNYSVAARK
jgi:SAM-dependent methyltransferase